MAKRTSAKKQLKLVIDVNVFVISLTSRSPFHILFKSLVNGNFELLVCTEILLEYEEIINLKYGNKTARYFINLLTELPNVSNISPFYRWNLINSDKDDNKYVDCSIAGQADYIVTEDAHFDILKNISFPGVKVINIDKFISLLQDE